MRPKISVVMAHYNREDLLLNTLYTIKMSEIKDVEIIVVDDCSTNTDLSAVKDLFPTVKVLYTQNKNYLNPCMPYNRAIAEATGEIVVIQNPECCHVGDVLKYFVEHLNDSNYISISTYALNEDFTQKLNVSNLSSTLAQMPSICFRRGFGWYNHPVHRPVHYHFCSGILKTNLDKLGGFDERFANGIAYDDNELVERVTRLGLRKEIATDVCVLHQHHSKVKTIPIQDYRNAVERNRQLFERVQKEKTIKVGNSYAKG